MAVQIDLKKYGSLLEEFWDGLVSESRRKEKGIPLEKVKADLVKRGGCVNSYVVEVKPSARKELEALPDNVPVARRPQARNLRGSREKRNLLE